MLGFDFFKEENVHLLFEEKLTGRIKKVIYDLVLDKPIKKKEPCTHWTYGLDVCFHSLEEAKSEAIRYSNSGYKVAIMEFVESHDMFAW